MISSSRHNGHTIADAMADIIGMRWIAAIVDAIAAIVDVIAGMIGIQ